MQALEKMIEMMKLQGKQLQLLTAIIRVWPKEVEELNSSKGEDKQQEQKEEPTPLLSVANVERMERAPHLPRWMSAQCKLLKKLRGGGGGGGDG